MRQGAPADLSDEALVAAARNGDAAAFGALIDRHQRVVRGFARRIAGNVADGDDLAQETFVLAWSRLHAFRGASRFRVWLCGVAFRLNGDLRRRLVRAAARERAWGLTRDRVETPLDVGARTALHGALSGLSRAQRACVALCLGAQFTHQEAAEALGLPVGTVKSHVARGKSVLAARLAGRESRDSHA